MRPQMKEMVPADTLPEALHGAAKPDRGGHSDVDRDGERRVFFGQRAVHRRQMRCKRRGVPTWVRQTEISLNNTRTRTPVHNATALKNARLTTQFQHRRPVVCGKDSRGTRRQPFPQPTPTLRLEVLVANGQNLVDEVDLPGQGRSYREEQASLHPGGVRVDGVVEIISNLG